MDLSIADKLTMSLDDLAAARPKKAKPPAAVAKGRGGPRKDNKRAKGAKGAPRAENGGRQPRPAGSKGAGAARSQERGNKRQHIKAATKPRQEEASQRGAEATRARRQKKLDVTRMQNVMKASEDAAKPFMAPQSMKISFQAPKETRSRPAQPLHVRRAAEAERRAPFREQAPPMQRQRPRQPPRYEEYREAPRRPAYQEAYEQPYEGRSREGYEDSYENQFEAPRQKPVGRSGAARRKAAAAKLRMPGVNAPVA